MESFIADDGERLHLRIRGEGPPLVLLHGWTASHAVWNPILESLHARHRVFCPDARGHGGHPLTATRTPDVARLARDVANLLDHYGLDTAALAGHSMGALTLWQYIGDFGCARITRLCLIDQSPRLVTDAAWDMGIYGDFDAAHARRFAGEMEADFTESVLRLIAHGLNAGARATYDRNSRGWQQMREAIAGLDPLPLISIWNSLARADYRPVLPAITVPTLLVWGGASNFYTLATARYLLARIPDATLINHAEADHCPQLCTPERFAAELLAFLGPPSDWPRVD